MKINNLKYKITDIIKIIENLGYPIERFERADSVNPAIIYLNEKLKIEYHKSPNRLRVIKERRGLFYRSEYMRDTDDLVNALLRADVRATKQFFQLLNVSFASGEDKTKLETFYTFATEDKTSGIQLRWHSYIPHYVVVHEAFNVLLPPQFELMQAMLRSCASDYQSLILEIK